jgi:hypothetical protein
MRFPFVTRRHNRASFIWWLVVGVFVTQGVFATLVLCVGGNGHVAMETTHVPLSEPLSTQHGGELCLDVPILASAEKPMHSSVDRLWRLAPDDRTPALPPDAIPMASEVDVPCSPRWHGDLAVCDPFLLALRTVILLT